MKKLKSKELWPYFILLVLGLIPFLGFLFSDKSLYSSDQMAIVAARWFFESIKQGVYPLWSPYLMGGMPTVDALAGDAIYPPFILLGLFLPLHKLVGYLFISHLLLSGFFAFLLAKKFFHLSALPSLVLGVAYMLNTNQFTLINGGHTGKFYILTFLPVGLYFLLKTLKSTGKWYHYIGLSVSVSIFLFTSHIQLTYFVLIGFFIIWMFEISRTFLAQKYKECAKISLRFWVPILCGVGMAFMVFHPPYLYNQEYSVRGTEEKQTFEHATSWSNHPEETVSLLLPEYVGYNEGYWGRNPFKINSEYPGLTIWLLALLGIVLYKPKHKWAYITIGVLAIIYSIGAHTPLFKLFYNLVPGVKSFRAPSMILFWLVTSLWILSALFFKRIEAKEPLVNEKTEKRLKIFLGIIAFFFASLAVAPSIVTDVLGGIFSSEESRNISKLPAHLDTIRFGAIRSFILSIAVVGGFWAVAKEKIQLNHWLIICLVVTAIDLYSTNFKFVKTFDLDRVYPPSNVLKQLEKERELEPFRVFSMPGTFNKGAEVSYMQEVVNGFVDNELDFYRKFRGGDPQRNPNFYKNLKQSPNGSVSGNIFLNLLNVKYLLYRDQQSRQVGAAINKSYLPRSFIVYNWKQAPTDSILMRLEQQKYNPAHTVYISKSSRKPSFNPQPIDSVVPSHSIKEIERTVNKIVLEVNTEEKGILCLQETYFPHWNVYVNGSKSNLLRTNFLFRGVEVPQGKSVVRFEYSSPWIKRGIWVGFLSLVIIVFVSFTFQRYLNKSHE